MPGARIALPGADELIAGCDWLAGAPVPAVTELLAASRAVRLAEGHELYGSEERPERLFVLLAGRVGAWRGAPRAALPGVARGAGGSVGGPVELPVQGPAGPGVWYWIGDVAMTTMCLENVVAGIPYFATMKALSGGTDVLIVPAAALDRLLDVHPRTALEIARHVARRLQAFTEQATDLALLDVARRVAKYLVQHRTENTVELPLRQSDLADRLAASRQRVNTALAHFARRGWVVPEGRGRYRITDLAALRAYAGEPHDTGAERHS